MSPGPGRVDTSPPFVGRSRELIEIRRAIAGADRGAGGVLLVSGEPGIGKTRLVEEAVAGHPGPQGWGFCVTGRGAPAFRPWAAAVRQCADQRALDAVGSAGEDVRLLVQGGEDARRSADASRFWLFDGLTQVLAALGADGAAVVVLDDLQWADEDSVRLLQFVAVEARRLPVLVVGIYRETDVEPDGALATALPDLVRSGPLLTLHGLSPTELGVLAGCMLDAGSFSGKESLLGSALHRRTGGNPFFARELLRLGEAESLLRVGARDTPPMPEGVRAVVSRHLARLPQQTYDVLTWAAVAGSPFEVDVVAAAAGRPTGAVLAALHPAVASRTVVPVDEQRFAFAHDLVRETLVSSIGLGERTTRHWALGAVLARIAGEDHERTTGAAAHLVAGVAAGDVGEAVRWAVLAAERSTAVLAFEDAAAWYDRALATRRREVSGDEGESRLLLDLAAARLDAGQLAAARHAFLAAAGLARTRGDVERMAAAALGLGAGLAGFEVPLFDQVQIDLLDEALAALPVADSPLRAWVTARLSVALAFVTDHHRRSRLSDEAVAMARRVGDDVVLAYALAAWCDANSGADDVERRLAVAGEVVRLADAAELRPLALLGRRLRVVALLELGRLQDATVEVEAFGRAADALRQPLYRWYVPLWRATLAMAVGDLDQAARLTEEAERIGASAHSENARLLVTVQRWVRLRHERRFAEAATLATGLLEDVPGVAAPESLTWALVVGDVVSGEPERARRRADALLAQGLHAPRSDSEWLANLAQLAQAAVALHHRGLAALVYDTMRPYAERFVVEGIGAAVCGSGAHYLAGLAGVLGREADAGRYGEMAFRLHRSAGFAMPPPLVAGVPAVTRQVPNDVAALGREGDVWVLTYDGTTVRVRDSKGLGDLAVLLRAPHRAVHVTELTHTPVSTSAADLDRMAVGAYRRRVADLEKEIGAAEDDLDGDRAARLRAERDFITAELASALGLGGRPRRSGDPVERARKAVSARIRDSIERIGALHPALGRHLAISVRTGTWCAYSPERPVRWRG